MNRTAFALAVAAAVGARQSNADELFAEHVAGRSVEVVAEAAAIILHLIDDGDHRPHLNDALGRLLAERTRRLSDDT